MPSSSSSDCPYTDLVLADGPVYYYKMDEVSGTVLVDQTRLGYNGVTADVILQQDSLITCDSNGAIGFDGADSIAGAPVTTGSGPGNTQGATDHKTLELWFRANGTVGRQMIYEIGSSNAGFNIYLNGNTLYGGAWDLSTAALFTSFNGIVAGQDYHVALVYDGPSGGVLTLYLNGDPVSTSSIPAFSSQVADGGSAGIGFVNGSTFTHDFDTSGGNLFNGIIDELALYNKALSLLEVLNHYAVGSSTDISSDSTFVESSESSDTIGCQYAEEVLADFPIWYYRMDETSGSVLVDSSGNGRDGTINGPTLAQPSLVICDVNGAMSFDGTNDRCVPFRNSATQGTTTQKTLEAWFNADDLTGIGYIVEIADQIRGFSIYHDGTTLYGGAWTSSSFLGFVPFTITAGVTYHVVVTYNAGVVKMFVNGILAGVAATGSTWNQRTQSSGIGRVEGNTRRHNGALQSAGGSYFEGRIDEVALYNFDIGTERAIAHYEAGLGDNISSDSTFVASSNSSSSSSDSSVSSLSSDSTFIASSQSSTSSSQSTPSTSSSSSPFESSSSSSNDSNTRLWNPRDAADFALNGKLWLDAEDVSTIEFVDGATAGYDPPNKLEVTRWLDKSPNENHAVATISTRRPEYEPDIDGLRFSGSDYLDFDKLVELDPSELNIFVVARTSQSANNCDIWSKGRTNANPRLRMRTAGNPSNDNRIFRFEVRESDGTNTTPGVVFGSGEEDSIVRLFFAQLDQPGNSATVRTNANRESDTNNRTWNANFSSDIETLGAVATNATGGRGGYFVGNIYEVLIFNKILSAADREIVEGYLSHKWDITELMPFTHPYRFSPPTVLDLSSSSTSESTPHTSSESSTSFDNSSVSSSDSSISSPADNPSGGSSSSSSSIERWLPKYLDPINLMLHLDATRLETITVDNTNRVSQWRDLSAYDNNASQPFSGRAFRLVPNLINNLHAMELEAFREQFMDIKEILEKDDLHVFEVALSTEFENFVWSQGAAGRGPYLTFDGDSVTAVSTTNGIVSTATQSYPMGDTIIAQFHRQNDQLYSAVTGNDGPVTPVMGPYDLAPSNGILGAGPYVPQNYSGMHLGEIIIYSGHLTDANKERIEGYLAWKWGLEDDLPIAHPYKLFPPTVELSSDSTGAGSSQTSSSDSSISEAESDVSSSTSTDSSATTSESSESISSGSSESFLTTSSLSTETSDSTEILSSDTSESSSTSSQSSTSSTSDSSTSSSSDSSLSSDSTSESSVSSSSTEQEFGLNIQPDSTVHLIGVYGEPTVGITILVNGSEASITRVDTVERKGSLFTSYRIIPRPCRLDEVLFVSDGSGDIPAMSTLLFGQANNSKLLCSNEILNSTFVEARLPLVRTKFEDCTTNEEEVFAKHTVLKLLPERISCDDFWKREMALRNLDGQLTPDCVQVSIDDNDCLDKFNQSSDSTLSTSVTSESSNSSESLSSVSSLDASYFFEDFCESSANGKYEPSGSFNNRPSFDNGLNSFLWFKGPGLGWATSIGAPGGVIEYENFETQPDNGTWVVVNGCSPAGIVASSPFSSSTSSKSSLSSESTSSTSDSSTSSTSESSTSTSSDSSTSTSSTSTSSTSTSSTSDTSTSSTSDSSDSSESTGSSDSPSSQSSDSVIFGTSLAWNRWVGVGALQPVNSGSQISDLAITSDGLPISKSSPNNIGYLFEGFIDLPFSETYTFFTTSDDNSRLFVNGVQVVDNWFIQSSTERSGNIALAAGVYTFRVEFANNTGPHNISCRVQSTSLAKQLIPLSWVGQTG